MFVVEEPSSISVDVSDASVYVWVTISLVSSVLVTMLGSMSTVDITGLLPVLVSVSVVIVGSRSVVVVLKTEHVCGPSLNDPSSIFVL